MVFVCKRKWEMLEVFGNKVVVVTGAGRGIGRGIACRLATLGAQLAILDLDESGMRETVKLIEAEGVTAIAYKCDITNEDEVVTTFRNIVTDFGRVDGLVNNAGTIRDGLMVKAKGGKVVSKLSLDDFEFVLGVCLRGAFLCAREGVSSMIESGCEAGVIINISSGAFRGNFGQTNYSAAKAGLVAMSRVWAKEYGRFNIRSMIIAPGAVETDLLRSMSADSLTALAATIPLRRIGQIENIAQAVVQIFENDYLTGSILEVNGGMTV